MADDDLPTHSHEPGRLRRWWRDAQRLSTEPDWAELGVHPSELPGSRRSRQAYWEQLGVHPLEVLGDERDDEVPLTGLRWSELPADELTWLTVAVMDPADSAIDNRSLPGEAQRWWRSVGDRLIMAALQLSALDYEVTFRSWGVVFEVGFVTEGQATAFRSSAVLRSAVDQLGPLRLEVTSGRDGGTAGVRSPRRPRPFAGAGSAELPEPEPEPAWEPEVDRPEHRSLSHLHGG